MQKNPKVPAIGIRLDPLKLKKMLRCVTFETSRTGYETFPKIHNNNTFGRHFCAFRPVRA